MKTKLCRYRFMIVVLSCCAILFGCNSNKNTRKHETIVTAKIKRSENQLFFSGTIQPINTHPVTSPVDGIVQEIKFQYGELVKKGDELVAINSPQLADDYRKNVTDYLKAKDQYFSSIDDYQANKVLYNAGVIDKESYNASASTYENNSLAYLQAQFELEKTLKQLNINPQEIERLTLKNLNIIDKLLRRYFSHIVINAPADGVALFPIAGETGPSDNDKGSGKLVVGTSVKAGGLMLSIGDLSGLAVQIQVSEIDINHISAGMPVNITGDAFPGIVLHGYLRDVSSQANPDQGAGGGGGALSMFNATVAVPAVSTKQRIEIHVGMTAKVEVDITQKPRITLPINAVFLKNGKSYVTIVDASGARTDVAVEVGTTTPTDIIIEKGIKDGDRVVVRNSI